MGTIVRTSLLVMAIILSVGVLFAFDKQDVRKDLPKGVAPVLIELESTVNPALNNTSAEVKKPDNISGRYVRKTENEHAELTVELLPSSRARISGISRWRLKSHHAPRIGRLHFEAPFKDGQVTFSDIFIDQAWNMWVYKIDLTFHENGITVKEQNAWGYFNANIRTNVKFEGDYSKIAAANQLSTKPQNIKQDKKTSLAVKEPVKLKQVKINDEYAFRSYETFDKDRGYEILHNGKVVASEGGYIKCSLSAEDLESAGALPPIGKNITGDGIPNLVVGCDTGGSHCCEDITIYSLGESLKVIKDFHISYSTFELIDLDGDGIYELKIADWNFQGWGGVWMGGACEGIANQDVILRYKNGDYQIAPDLMKRFSKKIDPPSLEKIKEEFNDTDSDYPVSFEMWRYMLALIYQGRGDEAFEFCNTVWPKERKYKDKFLAAFKLQLTKSPYWLGIKELNGW